MHEDAYLSYKRYKVQNFVSKAIQDTQVPIYTNTHYFCIFLIFLFKKKKLKTKQKLTNKKNKASKLDWLKPQHEPCKRSKKIRNQLEYFSFQMRDLDGDPFFCLNLYSDG